MSRLAMTPALVAPASGTLAVSAAASWASGSWGQLVASAAADMYATGLAIKVVGGAAQQLEIDLGVGAASAETVIHTLRVQMSGGGNLDFQHLMVPVPLGGIATGDRVAVRVRGDIITSLEVNLLYHDGMTQAHKTALACKPLPSAANSPTVTPSGTSWANSAWTQLTSGIANEIALLGLAIAAGNVASEQEWDIGLGGAGAETVVTTVRCTTRTVAETSHLGPWLPAPLPIAPNTRVAVRCRISTTGTTAMAVGGTYLDGTALL